MTVAPKCAGNVDKASGYKDCSVGECNRGISYQNNMVFRACDVIYKGETLPVKYAFAIGFEDEMSSAEEVIVPLHLGGNMPVLQIGGQIDENTGETKPLEDLHKVKRIRINALDGLKD